MGDRSRVRYGEGTGYALTAGATLAVSATKVVSGGDIAVSADVDFLAVVPFCVASATDAGKTAEFQFVGQMVDGATYDTNPMVVRTMLDNSGFNKGPIDHLPVKGYRRVKLTGIKNNSASATLSQVNVEYRTLK